MLFLAVLISRPIAAGQADGYWILTNAHSVEMPMAKSKQRN
jgi:hypothetical protein